MAVNEAAIRWKRSRNVPRLCLRPDAPQIAEVD
jgi:hypothetical protein